MLDTVRIGHKFPRDGQPKMFNPPMGHTVWNKLFAARTLFPDDVCGNLQGMLLAESNGRDAQSAHDLYRADYHIIAQELARNASIFVHDAHWLADKFHIFLP